MQFRGRGDPCSCLCIVQGVFCSRMDAPDSIFKSNHHLLVVPVVIQGIFRHRAVFIAVQNVQDNSAYLIHR